MGRKPIKPPGRKPRILSGIASSRATTIASGKGMIVDNPSVITPPVPAPPPPPPPGGGTGGVSDTLNANSAYDMLSHIGVNTHFNYGAGVGGGHYQNLTACKNAMDYIKVKLCRDHIEADGGTPTWTNLESMYTWGAQFGFIYNGAGGDETTWVNTYPGEFEHQNANSVVYIEGLNESQGNGATWFRNHAIAMSAAILGNQYVDTKLRVQASTIMQNGDWTFVNAVGDLSAYIDQGNLHIYANEAQPWNIYGGVWTWAYSLTTQRVMCPTKPIAVTETGFPVGVQGGYIFGNNQHTQAIKSLNTICTAWLQSPGFMIFYELLDEAYGNTTSESVFGLFDGSGNAKQAATYLHNFMTAMWNNTLYGFNGTVSYSIAGLPANSHHFVVRKNSNTYAIIVWCEPSVWTGGSNGSEVVPPDVTGVTVTFTNPASASAVAVYDPAQSASPIATYTNRNQVVITLKEHPIIIECTY